MKSFLLTAAASLTILAGATNSADAQDRGYRNSPQNGYGSNNGARYGNDRDDDGRNDRWDGNDDRRYQGYDRGQWRYDRGNYWNAGNRMSPAEYNRWRRYQRYRQSNRRDWAYQQGVRDGRRQNNRGGSCGNGRW